MTFLAMLPDSCGTGYLFCGWVTGRRGRITLWNEHKEVTSTLHFSLCIITGKDYRIKVC